MMWLVNIVNFDDWRNKARYLISEKISPDRVCFASILQTQVHLFSEFKFPTYFDKNLATFNVPEAFISLAKNVAHFRDDKKWHLLYMALWRIINDEKSLLQIVSDPLIRELNLMVKGVKRDAHKMKAFVRFRCIEENREKHYIAWYKPDHFVLRLVAHFFQERFQVMRFSILTPDESLHWDTKKLFFTEPVSQNELSPDRFEDLWRTYYRSIFNPARVKIKAMKKEMPVRFWSMLPETEDITSMLQEAPQRVAKMLKHQEGIESSANQFIQSHSTLYELAKSAQNCTACPLHRCGKKTIFGHGTANAALMIVSDQLLVNEDNTEEFFNESASQMLQATLTTLGVNQNQIYYTTAVKHSKFIYQDDKLINLSPNIREIYACKPWLIEEIKLIQPKAILCLGLTAAKALISNGFNMKAQHGKSFNYNPVTVMTATFHPVTILRTIDLTAQESLKAAFVNDIQNLIKQFIHKE